MKQYACYRTFIKDGCVKDDNIETKVKEWVDKLNEETTNHQYEYHKTPKYYKVEDKDSVFAFVDKENGDIYKPASYNTPAKGVRGNVFDDKLPMKNGDLYYRDSKPSNHKITTKDVEEPEPNYTAENDENEEIVYRKALDGNQLSTLDYDKIENSNPFIIALKNNKVVGFYSKITNKTYVDVIVKDSCVRKLTKDAVEGLKIETESTGYHDGQMDMVKTAYLDNTLVGYLEYSVYEEKPYIQMIQVSDEYKRQGIGTALLKDLQKDYPGAPINVGMTTKEGSSFINKVTKNVDNPQYIEIKKQLEELKQQEKDIQKKWDEFYASDMRSMNEKEVDELNDLHSEVNRKIRELEKKLEKTQSNFTYVKDSHKRALDSIKKYKASVKDNETHITYLVYGYRTGIEGEFDNEKEAIDFAKKNNYSSVYKNTYIYNSKGQQINPYDPNNSQVVWSNPKFSLYEVYMNNPWSKREDKDPTLVFESTALELAVKVAKDYVKEGNTGVVVKQNGEIIERLNDSKPLHKSHK